MIEKILQESVRYAPTSKNTQKVSVIVVKGDRLQALADELKRAVIKFYKMSKLLRRISKKMKSQWHMVSNAMEAYQQGLDICMRGAPVALFFVTDDLDTKDWYASGTILAYHTVLTAEISGLKTCLLGMILNALPFAKKVPEIIELPKDNKIIMAVLMGYSRVKYRRLTPRNPLDIKYLT